MDTSFDFSPPSTLGNRSRLEGVKLPGDSLRPLADGPTRLRPVGVVSESSESCEPSRVRTIAILERRGGVVEDGELELEWPVVFALALMIRGKVCVV